MEKEEIRQKIINKFNREDFEIIEATTSKEPVVFKCLKCGEIIRLGRLDTLLDKNRKNLCPKCDRKGKLSEKGLELKNKFEYWYNNIGHKNYELITDFTTVKGKIQLRCLKCGSVQNRDVQKLLNDDRCLCCEKKVNAKKTNEQLDLELKQLFDDEYERIGDYININTPILFRHNICNKVFSMSPHRLLTNRGRCPCQTKDSKGELKIQKFLEENNIKYITQYRLESFIKAPFDFYLPDSNILIEYQGIQHFEPRDFFGGEKQFKKLVEIDNKKKKLAKDAGYKLIYISYKDYSILENILVQRLSVSSSELKKLMSELSDSDIV